MCIAATASASRWCRPRIRRSSCRCTLPVRDRGRADHGGRRHGGDRGREAGRVRLHGFPLKLRGATGAPLRPSPCRCGRRLRHGRRHGASARRGRAPRGLDPIRAEIDELCATTIAEVRRRADAYWDTYAANRDDAMLAAWFVPRCWREIDYVYMLGEQIRRYGARFERRHVTALARQLLDEAEHYDDVARIIERLGGTAPTEPPPSAVTWSKFLWDCLDRHPLGAIAAWNMSETAATGTLEGIVAAGQRYDLPQVVKTYEQIIRDEKFHVGLGRALLDRYIASDADVAEVRRAMTTMAAIVVESHVAIDSLSDAPGHLFFEDEAAFRAWLEANHETAPELLLAFRRRSTGLPSITWSEAVDVALCFGWIDGVRRGIDETAYSIRFTPRRAGRSGAPSTSSGWPSSRRRGS